MSGFNFIKAVREIAMSPTTKHVAITLATYADFKTGECYPSVQTLCADTGLSNRVICQHIKIIEKMGIIVVDRLNGRRSYYRFEIEKLILAAASQLPAVEKTSDSDDMKAVTLTTQAVTQSHKCEYETSDSDAKTSDSDDMKAVTLTTQAVTLMQKPVTQRHTNYYELPVELPIELNNNYCEEKFLVPLQFVMYKTDDLSHLNMIQLSQKYPILKFDFIELARPRHPDLEIPDLDCLFDEFGDWYATTDNFGKHQIKIPQKWAVSWLSWVNSNKQKLINRKLSALAAAQKIQKSLGQSKPNSSNQIKQDNVDRWKKYGERNSNHVEGALDPEPPYPKNLQIEEVGHA